MAPLLPAAREEFLETADLYDAQTPGLGEEFIAAVEHAAERIAAFPEHGSPYLADTRRVVLRRFPPSVVYQAEPEGPLIVAVAHHRRRPGTGAVGFEDRCDLVRAQPVAERRRRAGHAFRCSSDSGVPALRTLA